jgi:UrcA family protein
MNIFNSIHRSPVRPLALVLILGLLSATPALATDPASVKVSYADLDLSTIAGAQTLYGRIRTAARSVCGYEGRGVTDQAFWNACFRGAIADAVAKVNNPLLTAVHTGRPVDTTVAMLGK